MTYLSGENLVAGYGGADILHGCSIDVSEGEIAVIVGPNGSGKSTAMKAIFGMLKLKSGNVKIKGEDITSLSCLLYTSPSPRDRSLSRMPSSA